MYSPLPCPTPPCPAVPAPLKLRLSGSADAVLDALHSRVMAKLPGDSVPAGLRRLVLQCLLECALQPSTAGGGFQLSAVVAADVGEETAAAIAALPPGCAAVRDLYRTPGHKLGELLAGLVHEGLVEVFDVGLTRYAALQPSWVHRAAPVVAAAPAAPAATAKQAAAAAATAVAAVQPASSAANTSRPSATPPLPLAVPSPPRTASREATPPAAPTPPVGALAASVPPLAAAAAAAGVPTPPALAAQLKTLQVSSDGGGLPAVRLVMSETAAATAVEALLVAPAVAVDCEGALQRGGSISLIQLYAPGAGGAAPGNSSSGGGTSSPCYVFDLHAMAPSVRSAAVRQLARLLESPSVVKVGGGEACTWVQQIPACWLAACTCERPPSTIQPASMSLRLLHTTLLLRILVAGAARRPCRQRGALVSAQHPAGASVGHAGGWAGGTGGQAGQHAVDAWRCSCPCPLACCLSVHVCPCLLPQPTCRWRLACCNSSAAWRAAALTSSMRLWA